MPESRDYAPTAVEQNIAAWLVAALDSFEGISIAYQNQGKVRLPRPFVTLQVITDFASTDPVEKVTDTLKPDGTYEVHTTEQREGSVQIRAVGTQSWAIMRAIGRSLRRQNVTDLNSANGIEILAELTSILDIPEQLSTTTEPRRQQDYSFAYCEVTIESVGAGVIKRVVATGDIYPNTPGIGIIPVVDESWPS